jgi:hypothetical protein
MEIGLLDNVLGPLQFRPKQASALYFNSSRPKYKNVVECVHTCISRGAFNTFILYLNKTCWYIYQIIIYK